LPKLVSGALDQFASQVAGPPPRAVVARRIMLQQLAGVQVYDDRDKALKDIGEERAYFWIRQRAGASLRS